MEAEDYFETLTPTGHIAESHFSEDKNLHSYRSDNHRSHEVYEQLEKSRAFLFFLVDFSVYLRTLINCTSYTMFDGRMILKYKQKFI